MQDKIKKLKEHYIVCGYGRIGSSICLKLFELDISFVIIEPDQERAAVAQRRGFITVCGKATEDETLLFAGLRNAAGVIPCISDDATNIFISLAARELNPDIYIISRASEHEIESRMIRAGADSVVYPLKLGGEQIARIVAERAGKQAAADWSDACAGLLGYHLTMYRSFSETPITVAQARQNADAVTAVALRREFGEVLENPADTELMNRGDQLVCIVTMTAVAAHDNSDAERFTWNDAYRVGVDSIDEEHRVLFRYGRDFEKALAKGLRKQDLDKLFERLLRYTERHFAHEEELMRTHGYLDLDAHIQMHKELTLEVMALYKEKSRVHPRSVVDFLGTWLTTHIVAQDREFAAYLDEATR